MQTPNAGGYMPQSGRSIFAGFIPITLAVIVMIGSLSLYLQNKCVSNFNESIILYPDAELIHQEAVFLGMQRMVYRTTDSPVEVEGWLNQQRSTALRNAVQSGNFSEVPPNAWQLYADNNATNIIFEAMCP